MAITGRPARRGAARLDRQRILDAARALCDEEGLPALTMRRLGAELGVDSTAMYRHFRDKEALLSTLIDELFLDIAEPPANAPWRDNLREIMRSWWRIYRDHASLAQAMAGQADDEPQLFHLTDWCLRELLRAGITPAEIGHAYQAVYNHTVGHGLVAAFSPWITNTTDRDGQRRTYAALDPAIFPAAQASAWVLYPDPEEVFADSTELLLDALEARGTRL
ncbi:TetR/AcrR family transcriptional regulator C-terminal domain-containing protein [Leifsonia kafniensis]|uniref:TetR/AcrR family transcriptional regulator C-terminal domain-containing protein n=1 Tax=Leifsonia kafniensis TaxID=475957 RepID=A0ABP7K0F9_9MICO